MRTWELPSCEMHLQEPENHAMDIERNYATLTELNTHTESINTLERNNDFPLMLRLNSMYLRHLNIPLLTRLSSMLLERTIYLALR